MLDREALLDPAANARVALAIAESAKTAMLSSKHAPIGSKSNGRNWIEADKPGGNGQLPAYIQNIRNALMRERGMPQSKATAIAISRVKAWAAGGGDVGPEVKAAAAKAVAEWEAMKARAHAVKEAPTFGAKPPAKPKTVKPAPAYKPKKPAATSSGFEQQHPRGRGGQWTVKQGASGSEVRRIQKRVGAKVDGSFGAKTAAAVRAFQRANGLQVDGVVGRQTMAALRGNRSAKTIRPGAMTSGDRSFLRTGVNPSRPRAAKNTRRI